MVGFFGPPLVSPSSSMFPVGCFKCNPLSSLLHHLTLICVVSPTASQGMPPKGSASCPCAGRQGETAAFGFPGCSRGSFQLLGSQLLAVQPLNLPVRETCRGRFPKTLLTLFLPKAKFSSSGCYVRRPHSADVLT